MSIFAGTPDYSHIIWAPQRFPEGESGIDGMMNGLTQGIGMAADFTNAKKDWKKEKAQAEAEGKPFDKPKPNFIKSYFGADDWQNQQSDASSQQQQGDPSQQPQGTQLGMSGGGFAPVNTGQAVSYLGGVTQQMNAMIDSQQDLLSKLNGGYNA